jgi:excisionase family DNA binding protein
MSGSTIRITKKCEWCAKEFTAQKVTTKYCSPRCANLAYKERRRISQANAVHEYDVKNEYLDSVEPLKNKEYLSPDDVAKLLNIHRTTVYRYLMNGSIPCIQFKGKTRISKFAIKRIFENCSSYEPRPNRERAPITEWYSTEEIIKKFGISHTWVYKIGKEMKIPKTLHKGKTMWSARHFDRYFEKNSPQTDITEWYTTDEMKTKFGMSTTAVYNFVSRYAIPKRKERNNVFYSKKHVDMAKGLPTEEDESTKYYTAEEAIKKYNLTKDQLYHYLRYHKVPRVLKGKYVYISRKELDDLLSPPKL